MSTSFIEHAAATGDPAAYHRPVGSGHYAFARSLRCIQANPRCERCRAPSQIVITSPNTGKMHAVCRRCADHLHGDPSTHRYSGAEKNARLARLRQKTPCLR